MNYDYSATYTGGDAAGALAGGAAAGIFGAMILIWLIAMVFALAVYIYFAFCLMKIANKTNTPNSWFAWIPILNVILMLQISQKPMWWLIFFFIPILNILGIIFMVLMWMAIAERVGKPSWWGILMIVPIANLIVPGVLAFSKGGEQSPAPVQ